MSFTGTYGFPSQLELLADGDNCGPIDLVESESVNGRKLLVQSTCIFEVSP